MTVLDSLYTQETDLKLNHQIRIIQDEIKHDTEALFA